VQGANGGRVALIVGASAETAEECARHARHADEIDADAYLVAVPERFYSDQSSAIGYFQTIVSMSNAPLIIQDLQFGGYGLDLSVIALLWERLPSLLGFKIETVPAGPKYTAVRRALGEGVFIAGGWAIQQMIEALDRKVDALIPESSMVSIYRAVYDLHASGKREDATVLFRRLLPVLAFTNQDLVTSIAFFKRLLVRKGVFETEFRRKGGSVWDEFSDKIADELIDRVLTVEGELRN
jgi:4-hydroxy-tetrahydrodipicolinate synthase